MSSTAMQTLYYHNDNGSMTESFQHYTLATLGQRSKGPGVLDLVGKIYYPLVVFVGMTGNLLNLVVLRRPSMVRYSSTVYLQGLAVADIGVLIFQTTLKYIVYKGWHVTYPRMLHVFLCVYNPWLTIGAIRTSFWITLGFTIERYIAIAYPIRGKTLCTASRAKKTVALLFVCGYAYGTHALVLREVTDDNRCVFSPYGHSISTRITKMNAACFAVTFSLLAIFNGLIIFTLCTQSRQRKTMGTGGNGANERRITVTLLAVSLIFMILWGPWLIIYLKSQLPNNISELSGADNLALSAEFMGVLNSAINFFLYTMTSQRFRRELKAVVCRASPMGPHSALSTLAISSQRTTLSMVSNGKSRQVLSGVGLSSPHKVSKEKRTSYTIKTGTHVDGTYSPQTDNQL